MGEIISVEQTRLHFIGPTGERYRSKSEVDRYLAKSPPPRSNAMVVVEEEGDVGGTGGGGVHGRESGVNAQVGALEDDLLDIKRVLENNTCMYACMYIYIYIYVCVHDIHVVHVKYAYCIRLHVKKNEDFL